MLIVDGFIGAVGGALVLLNGLSAVRRPALGPVVVVAIAYLLPFSVPPLEILSLSPSFLDYALFLALAAWWFTRMRDRRQSILMGPAGPWLLLFLVTAVVSFLLAWERTSPQQARMFLKLVNSVFVYFTVLNVLTTRQEIETAVKVILAGAAVAAAVGVALYVVPEGIDYALRDSLSAVGYPGGETIVRQIAGTDIRRATGTAVDPNLLGGMLALAVPLATALAVSPRSLVRAGLVWPALLLMITAQVLTYSRGAWLASATGVVLVGLLRYPKAWAVLLVIPAFLFLPQGEVIISRAAGALGASDPASQMRLGEYKDALSVIGAYPLFGVGFGDAPAGVPYVGVSSIYLLIGELTGIAGLVFFLLTMGTLARHTAGALWPLSVRPHPVLAGLAGSLAAALVAGTVDHYFFNPQIPHTTTLFWVFAGLLTRAITVYGTNDGPLRGREKAVSGRGREAYT